MDREQVVQYKLPSSRPGSIHNQPVADLVTPPREKKKYWTTEEDSILVNVMQKNLPGKKRDNIASMLPDRSRAAVSTRWQFLKKTRTSPPSAFPSFEAEVDWVGKSASGSAVTVDLTGGSLVYKAKKGDKQFLNDEPTPKRNRASNMSAKKAPAKRAKKSKAAASAEKADK